MRLRPLATPSILLILILSLACSKTDASPTTSTTPSGTPGASATGSSSRPSPNTADQWDPRAVWDWQKADNAWRIGCNSAPNLVQSGATCVLDAMSQGGAGQQAMSFYRQTGYFLVSFKELGTVDYGVGGAPWFNMGRPTNQLLLNGSPSVQEIGSHIPTDWKQDATYADLLKASPDAFPWQEYAKLGQLSATTGGGQHIELEYPMRVCRACPDLGYLVIAYEFDAAGNSTAVKTLPLKKP